MRQSIQQLARLFIVALIVTVAATFIKAQDTNSAVQSGATLRAQLSDVQAKETELQGRLKQLDNDLLPQNIELSQAANGSTHPEDVREQRRRQLEAEKARVQAQLSQLAASRTRLEAAITRADADAYRQSANTGVANSTTTPSSSSSSVSSTGKQISTATEETPGVDSTLERQSTQARSNTRRSRRTSTRHRTHRSRAH
jgi:uncharacterized protein YlxW (UPF0749 family)